MKRTWAMMTVLAMAASLCACGKGGNGKVPATAQQPTKAAEKAESPEGGAEGAAAAKEDVIVLKYAAAEVPGTPENDANLNFIKTIEEKSNGKIKVEYYHSSQLGNDKQVVVAALGGSLDIVKSSAGNLMDYSDALAFADLPGLFKNQKHLRAVFQDEVVRKEISDDIFGDIGMVPVNFDVDGGAARALFYNRKGGAAKLPGDMKGVKMRTTGSEIEMALFSQWGASSVPMNFNELYLALQQGTVDGLYGHPIGTYGNKLCEVTKYCTVIDMSYIASVQLMSKGCIEKLGGEGSELYEIVMEAGKELELYKDKLIEEKLGSIMEQIQADGVEVYVPGSQEIGQWRATGQAVWEDYVGEGKMVPQKIVDEVVAIGEGF
ncbi:TRAP transporter substrate-binding protein [Clostridiaceae bacterium]|nr:TRAP transporter substrate-binding protein [Clostridiaceae bacterium]RKI10581.1 TRAP transporter substrate-binding protein [bacterium 1XD21-70]